MEMSNKNDITIVRLDTLDEIKTFFLACRITRKYLWYRGVSHASYRLIPKAYRDIEPYADQLGRPIDGYFPAASGTKFLLHDYDHMLFRFKELLHNKVSKKISTYFDWMFLAQHFGLSTPLLDWTEDYRVALWFACESTNRTKHTNSDDYRGKDVSDFEFSDNYIAIYIISPNKLNKEITDFCKISRPLNVDKDLNYANLFRPDNNNRPFGPTCLKGKWNLDTRLAHQKGHFTIHGTCIWPIDYYTIVRKMISKILIPIELVYCVKKWLSQEGINKKYIYQGKDWKEEISNNLNKKEKKEYKEALRSLKETINLNYSLQ